MQAKKLNQKMTLLTLVVALGVAVYLNWEYAKSTDLVMGDTVQANAAASTGIITDELAVETAASGQETADKNYGEAQLVSVADPTGSDFFEQARLSRTKTRDEALDTLQKSLKNSALTQEEKDKQSELNKKLVKYRGDKDAKLKEAGSKNKLVRQLVDLALLSNGMLKGENLTNFIRRSVEMIEK